MKFYIQKDSEGYISDIITFPYGNYEGIEFEPPLPMGIMGRYFKFAKGKFVLDQAKYEEVNRVPVLIQENDSLKRAVDEFAKSVSKEKLDEIDQMFPDLGISDSRRKA